MLRTLIAPTVSLRQPWVDAHAEWGPGLHEDGFGLQAGDEVDSPEGFAAWVTRLLSEAVDCTYRWIVEGGRVQGGIALRHQPDDLTGHLGFGVRPSARGRGIASWALGCMLDEARARSVDRVLLICEADNVASARTIERNGGVLQGSSAPCSLRRYWIEL